MDFLKKENENYVFCNEEDAEFCIISIKEYNGYENALRIIKDRALQQIVKSQADENGYRLLKCQRRYYSREAKNKSYLITYSTPYSINMDVEMVNILIMRDLIENYNYTLFPTFIFKDKMGIESRYTYTANDLINDHYRYYTKGLKGDNILDELKYEFMENFKGKIAFEIDNLSPNYAHGVYEVSYWITSIMEEGVHLINEDK